MFYLDLVSGHDFVARIFCSSEENGSPVRFLTDCGSVPGGSVSKPVPCRFNSLRFLNSGSGRFVGLLSWKQTYQWNIPPMNGGFQRTITLNGPYSIAMFDYRRVSHHLDPVPGVSSLIHV